MNAVLVECFNAAVETLNFTAAAQKVCISQPTFSRNIAMLEELVGFPLFIRSKQNGLSVTPAGRTLYEGLAQLTTQYRTLLEQARQISRGEQGRLVIGVLSGAALDNTTRECINQFRDRYPGTRVELLSCSLNELEENVIKGSCDVCFMMSNLIRAKESACYKPMLRIDSYLAVPKRLNLDAQRVYSLSDFKDQVFILSRNFPAVRDDFLHTCRGIGFEPKIKLAPDFETAMLWVNLGEGVTGNVRNRYAGSMEHIDFVPVSDLADMVFSVVWRRNATNPVINLFCSFLDEFESSGSV